MYLNRSRLVLFFALFPVIGATAYGQPATSASGVAAATLSAVATPVPEAPIVDGEVIGDPAWANATPISAFWQEQPNEGQPASERTEVRVVFTADTLYVGVMLFDQDPSGIIVSDARRDAPLDDTDSFQVIFDTYRDRQNGFVFGTNPAGIEYDGQVTNEGEGGGGLGAGQRQSGGSGSGFNINWDAAWTVRAKISEQGWSAEFAIPFRTLRYPAGTDQAWGVNFQRNIRRKNERAYWAPIPRQFSLYRLSLAGSLVGVKTAPLRNFTVTPYVLGNALASGERPIDSTLLGDVGGDMKYSITPSLTLDGTINTDFAQVEVDDQQVNLDRFTLFFPEKRPFFLENAGFFSVGNPGEVDLFFSRRIGIGEEGQAIPIMGGARVSGKAGKFNLGLLNMQTDDYEDRLPSTNFSVARVSRDLPNRSSIGGIFTNRLGTGDAPDDDYGRTYGLDGKLGLGLTTTISGFAARTETPGVSDSDHAFNLRSQTNRKQWDLNLGYQEVGGGFNPEIGFLSRRGYRKYDASLMTRFRPTDFINIQELRPHSTFRGFWGLDGFQETGYLHLDNHWQFRDSTEIHTGMNLTLEGVRVPFEIYPGVFVPPGTYEHAEAQLVAMSNQSAPFSVSMRATIGGFFGGDRVALNPTIRFRHGDALTTELNYQRNDIDLPWGSFHTNLVRSRVSYSFSPRVFTQALIQYNDRADLWSMNFRFGWLQAANTGLFVVYTDTHGLYDLYDRPERTDRSFIIKYSRMFELF